jgi:lysophospholipase L1-like esterase
MPSEEQITPQVTWRSRIWQIVVVGALVLVAVELAFRIFMAMQLGPRALFYGTPWFRQEISVAKMRDVEWQGPRAPKVAREQWTGYHGDLRTGYSKYFPYETKIDLDDSGERFSYKLNGQGMRGPDFRIDKPADVIRVITLGASSTYGFGSRDDETYPSQLQQELNRRCASSRRYEVINFGIPHLTSGMIKALYQAEGVRLHPDVVTFYEGINDASTPPAQTMEGATRAMRRSVVVNEIYQSLIPIYHGIRDRSMALVFVDNLIQLPSRSTPEQVMAYRTKQRVATFLANLQDLRDIVQTNGARFVVVSQQAKSMMIPRDAIHGVTYAEEKHLVEAKLGDKGILTQQELFFLADADLMEALRTWVRAENVAFVDAAAKLDGDRDLLYTYVHPNPRGNAIIAHAMADEILRLTCKQ